MQHKQVLSVLLALLEKFNGTPSRLRSVPLQPVQPLSQVYKTYPLARAREYKFGPLARIRTRNTTFVALRDKSISLQGEIWRMV